MTRRRKTSDEERALFEETFAETRPLVPVRTVEEVRALVTQKRKKSGEELLGGVDGRTEERLRKGKVEPDARLDLHGYTETAAHDALLNFLRGAQARGHRMIIVVTGKGAKRDAGAPFDLELDRKARGILKTVVPRWLAEPAFARFVAAVRQAHVRHGGEGALYVYLRRPR
ncbi:MAG TPA: Smr/MutS family protein [Rhizomicrobium sp.]